MRLIPPCFYNKSIISQLNDLIDDGYQSYSELYDSDKERLAATCINILGEDSYNCIIESENFYKTMNHFSKFLSTSDMDEGHELLNVMKKNATDYFTDVLTNLFDECLSEIESDKKLNSGMFPHTDCETGEIIWRKSA